MGYIFSMPSVTMPSGEAETFGMVYLEAQACGVPVVAFRSGAVAEVVEQGKSGLLFEERDVEGLRQGIATLLRDKALHRAMADHARRLVNERFSAIKIQKQLELIYKTLTP